MGLTKAGLAGSIYGIRNEDIFFLAYFTRLMRKIMKSVGNNSNYIEYVVNRKLSSARQICDYVRSSG